MNFYLTKLLSNKRSGRPAQMQICQPSLLKYTKYGCRGRHEPKFRPLALLDMSARGFQGGICGNAISTKITLSGPKGLHEIESSEDNNGREQR